MMPPTLAIGPLGGWELVIIAVVGLLIFGKRLPEVGRSLGKGIVEFKKGLQGIEDDVNSPGSQRKIDRDTTSHMAKPDTREPSDQHASRG
jgi:sec-independent protein translocase protein TatA